MQQQNNKEQRQNFNNSVLILSTLSTHNIITTSHNITHIIKQRCNYGSIEKYWFIPLKYSKRKKLNYMLK
jgi:hypothetical protein